MSNKPTDKKPELSETRRTFIKQSAAVWGSTLLAGFGAPSIVMAQSTKIETTKAKLGFIALTDAAPLFVGIEKGFFKNTACPMWKYSSNHPGAPPAIISCWALPTVVSMAPTF